MSKSAKIRAMGVIHSEEVKEKSRELIEHLNDSAISKDDILLATEIIDALIYEAIDNGFQHGFEMACKLRD